MTTKTILPDLPRANMFDNRSDVMSRIWQEFFRTLFVRVGGNLELSNSELADIVNQITALRTTTDSAVSVLPTDGTILIDASSNNISISHVSAVGLSGIEFIFKRIDDSDNTVTITANGAETIDGDQSVELYAFESINTKSDNSDWWII